MISEDKKIEIIRIIQDYAGTDEDISMESDMVNDLGLSSFDAVMICDTVQEQLGVHVDIDSLYNCRTIGDLLKEIGE